MKQRSLFEPEPDDSEPDDSEPLELYTDGTWRRPGDQAELGFAVPFAESRSMLKAHLECNERSKQACEGFAEKFAEPEPDQAPALTIGRLAAALAEAGDQEPLSSFTDPDNDDSSAD